MDKEQEDLFNAWKALSNKVMNLGSIVQNPIGNPGNALDHDKVLLSPEDLELLLKLSDSVVTDIESLTNKTVDFIISKVA